jgi:RNA polymerase sigma-70 factor, ECF subfamily
MGVAVATDAMLASSIASAAPGAAREEEAELYRRFAPRVRLYGLKHLRDAAAAQDLVQQVFVVTIERLRRGELRMPASIGSFILSASRIVATDLRRTHERRERLTDTFIDRTTAVAPKDEALDTERVERCLNALSSRDRALLVLTFYAEKKASEIASSLQMAPGAVRVARHRALARLRDCVLSRRDGASSAESRTVDGSAPR